ncbi:hypothetical protein MRX96_000282 [Rhipicephalus microplus]
MAFHKIWRCQHHTKNKKSGPRNAKCMAKVDVKIKLVTFNTKHRDKYLQIEVPLSAVIRIDDRHSHSTDSADVLWHQVNKANMPALLQRRHDP